jgi:hypothetical protein
VHLWARVGLRTVAVVTRIRVGSELHNLVRVEPVIGVNGHRNVQSSDFEREWRGHQYRT